MNNIPPHIAMNDELCDAFASTIENAMIAYAIVHGIDVRDERTWDLTMYACDELHAFALTSPPLATFVRTFAMYARQFPVLRQSLARDVRNAFPVPPVVGDVARVDLI